MATIALNDSHTRTRTYIKFSKESQKKIYIWPKCVSVWMCVCVCVRADKIQRENSHTNFYRTKFYRNSETSINEIPRHWKKRERERKRYSDAYSLNFKSFATERKSEWHCE